jgi:hypothetical protein
MTATRVAAALIFLAVLAGTFALSKPSDVDVLTRVGKVTVERVKSGLPDNGKLTGPLAAFRAGDALPIEERVRVRIQTDKDLAGTEVSVVSTTTAGQVKLKGIVNSTQQKSRAVELAERTAGVVSVIEELAMPAP